MFTQQNYIADQLREVQKYIQRGRYGHFQVEGNCLEGAGVNSGDILQIDFQRMPKPPKYASGEEISPKDI